MSQDSIFVSHSSKEMSFVDSLLLQEKKESRYKLWAASNENIGLGKEFRHRITKAINDSSGAIILISNNLLSSKFVMEYELPLLIEKSKKSEDYFIIPILIEKCPWSESDLLKGLQLINSDNTPLKELKGKQYTVLIQEVSKYVTEYLTEIDEKIKSIRKSKRTGSLKASLLSLLLISLLSIFYLTGDNNIFSSSSEPIKSSPEQIFYDINSLTTEEQEELLELLESGGEVEIVEESEESNTFLTKVIPQSCDSSNEDTPIIDRNSTGCFNLIDSLRPPWGWVGSEFCADDWIKFKWEDPLYIEFVVIQNFENYEDFWNYGTIRDFTFRTPSNEIVSGTLDRENYSQWIDLNLVTNQLMLEIDSHDAGIGSSCGLQNVTFYGRQEVSS